jgi:hypothetical protein
VLRSELFRAGFVATNSFGELLGAGFAVPFLERLVRDLSFDQKLREFAALSFVCSYMALDSGHTSFMPDGLEDGWQFVRLVKLGDESSRGFPCELWSSVLRLQRLAPSALVTESPVSWSQFQVQ